MRNNFVRWITVIVVVPVLAIGSFDLYLIASHRGYQIHIGNFFTIRLGSPSAFLPKDLEASFITVASSSQTDVVQPRYQHNVIIRSETEGDIIGRDVTLQSDLKYSWGDQTHYVCISPDQAQAYGYGQQIDPAKVLQNYQFYFNGSSVPGIAAADFGLFMFRHDSSVSGTPAQMYVKNNTLNADGGYDLIGAVVFTKNKTCVTPDDVQVDFLNQ